MLNRRRIVAGLAAFVSLANVRVSRSAGQTITVTKNPECGCCDNWVDHLRQAGFAVEVRAAQDLDRIKTRLGVPGDLASCHTAEVSGYVIEGHVPASVLRRLLVEQPNARGLAVPGMPVGSPGMEVPDAPPDEYSVILFGKNRRVYARFRGAIELK